MLYVRRANYKAALPLYERGLAICEKTLGPGHPDTANSLNSLAGFYSDQDDCITALPLYERALAICERTLGLEHPDTLAIRENLALNRKRVSKTS